MLRYAHVLCYCQNHTGLIVYPAQAGQCKNDYESANVAASFKLLNGVKTAV